MSSCRAYDQWERRMANDEGEAPLTPEQKAAIMQKLTERSAAGGGASLTAELLGEIEDCMDALDGPGAQDDDQEVEGEPNNGIPSAAMKRLKELDVRSASDQAEAAELIEHLQQHGELKTSPDRRGAQAA